MKIAANCDCKADVTNLSKSEVRYESLLGRRHMVVPVVMAISNVVMNGALYPDSEYFAPSWNGAPVTIGHPSDENGDFLSANTPAALEKYAVGQIFNAVDNDGKLVAEAWIDVIRTNKIDPTLIKSLLAGHELDVSTGFFSNPVAQSGNSNGKDYTIVHTNVSPDHLALLPGDIGACNWDDGCGIRANKENPLMSAIRKLASFGKTGKKPAAAARGRDDDPRQMIADMIADDNTPFTPDDMSGLSYLSASGLKAIYDAYKSSGEEKVDGDEKPVSANEDQTDMTTKTTEKVVDIEAVVANAVKTAVDAALVAMAAKFELSADDKAALASAREVAANKRNDLIAHVLASTKIDAKELEAMSTATIEIIAKGLPKPTANYSGRAMPLDGNGKDSAGEAMGDTGGVVQAIRANAKKG
jgi:hypothetical protein